MIRLKICSFVVVLLMLFGVVVGQDDFGKIVDVDNPDPLGNTGDSAVKPDEVLGWGGQVFKLPKNRIAIDYGDGPVDYTGTDGKYIVGEYGKIVEAEFTVTEGGPLVIGNLKLDLEKGSKVTYVDGELKIEDPGDMIDRDDIDFIDNDAGWDDNHLRLEGDGVDYMGLDEVEVDKDGVYLRNPDGVEFAELEVYGEGKVYFFDSDGEPNLDIDAAYVSANPESGQFAIGSNALKNSVSVKPIAENSYGLKHDAADDYIAFKSIGGGESSYLTVKNRDVEELTPLVNGVGYFVVDDDGESVYFGEDDKIYVHPTGGLISDFSAGESASPIELHFGKMVGGEVVALEDYGGAVVIGNDGGWGYGFNPEFVLGGQRAAKYDSLKHLHYGASNSITYNYHLTEEGIEKLFNVRINDRIGYLKNPSNVRKMADIMFRLPFASQSLRSLDIWSGGGGSGDANTGMHINMYGWGTSTLIHELTHIFDWSARGTEDYYREWAATGGNNRVQTRGYGQGRNEKRTTLVENLFAGESTWQSLYAKSNGGGAKFAAGIAVLAKYGHVQHYDAARILSYGGYTVDRNNPVSTYNEIIKKFS